MVVNNINSAPKNDSFDEDEGVMLFKPDSRDENVSTSCTNDKEAACAPGTGVKHGTYNGHLRVVNANMLVLCIHHPRARTYKKNSQTRIFEQLVSNFRNLFQISMMMKTFNSSLNSLAKLSISHR